jgi:hypothetical protein
MLIRGARNNKGTTLVEFSLVVPLFILLTFGIIDFGWYFFVEHTLQYATREGMRLALVGRKLMDEHGNPMSREASIIKTIKDTASLAVDPSSLSIYIFPIGDDYTDPEHWEDLDPYAGGPGSYMRVKTRYAYKFLTPLIGAFFTGGSTLVEAQGTYRNELFDK